MACGIFVPQPEMELWPRAVEAWSLNHWTTWEVPNLVFQMALLVVIPSKQTQ